MAFGEAGVLRIGAARTPRLSRDTGHVGLPHGSWQGEAGGIGTRCQSRYGRLVRGQIHVPPLRGRGGRGHGAASAFCHGLVLGMVGGTQVCPLCKTIELGVSVLQPVSVVLPLSGGDRTFLSSWLR